MQYILFMFLALAYIAQASKYEQKEDFSYKAVLGSLEHYLRKGYLDVKNCYSQSKDDYKRVIDNFERKLLEFSNKQSGKDEKKVVGRIYKIAKELKAYNTKLNEFLQSITLDSSPEIATYVDSTRQEIKKDLDLHINNIENPLEWNRKKFKDLETSFRPIRDKFAEEVGEVEEKFAECMNAPKCD